MSARSCRLLGGLAPGEGGDAERDGRDGGPAATVDVREGREVGGEPGELVGPVRVGEPEGRAVHHRAVAGRDLGASLVPDRLGGGRGVLAGVDPAQDAPGEGADVGRVRAEPLKVAFEEVVGVEAVAGGERPHQVPGHRGVVGGGARGLVEPGLLESGDGVGDVARAQELERGAEGIPEREPEGAPDDAIGEVHGAAERTAGRGSRAGLEGGARGLCRRGRAG